MIEAAHLEKTFGSNKVVNDISFDIKSGTICGFLGPNGAGKSTTLRLLTGYLFPDAGTAKICSHDVTVKRQEAQACLGYLPEAATGFAHLTVREFLSFCGESRGFKGKLLIEAIEQACEQVELFPAIDQQMRTLSKGWRQRAWLAQAILANPSVLILDEPTDGLDPNQKERVRNLIRNIAAKKAIILSTHILEEIEEICTRVILISNGSIITDQTPSELADSNGRLGEAFRELTLAANSKDSIQR